MALLLVTSAAVRPNGQSPTVHVVGGVLHVRAPGADGGLGLLAGAALDRLQDGRALTVTLELGVVTEPDAETVTTHRRRYNVSYDLWEERFAVSVVGDTPQAISHLTVGQAEAWCLEQVTVPVSVLRTGTPFRVRLTYEVDGLTSGTEPSADTVQPLRTLIDLFGRRSSGESMGGTFESGPFELSPDRGTVRRPR